MIQSYDYDWISICAIMNCMLGAWDFVEPAYTCWKTSSMRATSMESGGMGKPLGDRGRNQ